MYNEAACDQLLHQWTGWHISLSYGHCFLQDLTCQHAQEVVDGDHGCRLGPSRWLSKAILCHDVANSDHTNMSAVLLLSHVVSCGARYVFPCTRTTRRVSLQNTNGRAAQKQLAQVFISLVCSSEPYHCII
jgi:hypothetical protein